MSGSHAVTAVLGETPYVVTLSDGTHLWLGDEPLESGGGGSEIRRRITLRGDLTADQRERLLQVANACPVAKTLGGEIHTTTSLG